MITHQGGSSPVQLAMANVMVMHFGQAVAAKTHLSKAEEDKRKERAKEADKKIRKHVQGVADVNTFNRMA